MPDQQTDHERATGGGPMPVAGAADDQGDDRSSSLSEPDEDIDDDDVINVAQYRPNRNGAVAEEQAQQSLEVDSEAETERIDQTPKSRKDAEPTQKTPSKLNQAATADDELSDPPSPVPTGPGAASSTSTLEPASTHCSSPLKVARPANSSAIDKKRKRSDTADSSLTSAGSDLGESPRKRSHSAAADENAEDKTAAEDATENVPEQSESLAEAQEPGADADAEETVTAPAPKVGRGRKAGRPKGKGKKEISKEIETENAEPDVQPEEEQSEEATAKSAEEIQHKQAASTVFEDLAKQFAAFREKINNERLAAVEAELEMLNQPDCKHDEYLRQVACVDARRHKQIKEVQAFYKFKMQSIRRSTLGERSQLHSQYFQHVRELREEVMYQLGEDWYNIQKERRQSHQDKDDAYVFKFPTKKSDQIKQQAKYNQEVSVLSGVAKYVGFPAAPDIAGAEGDALEDDLKAMKLSKRTHQQTAHPQPLFVPNRNGLMEGQRERLAHEQYLEQNAWARPQAPIHNHGTPNLTHTADWAAEPGTHSKNLMRNLGSGMHRTGSPYATPMPQRRAPVDQSSSGTVGVNSDPVDPPSSVLAAPPTSDRMGHAYLGREQASPLTVSKHRQNGGELTGFRNISGASTIDAPPDSAERDREAARDALMGISKQASAPQSVFDTSQVARHGFDKRQQEVYASASFRPQPGAFGTPTPGAGPLS